MEICLALSTTLQWAALLFYCSCFPPQILTNYRIKSTQGISDGFIWCYATGYLLMMLYVCGQPFAYPYRIMVPIEAALMGVVVGQKFYYHGFAKSKIFVLSLAASTIATIIAAFFIPTHGLVIATAAGWLALVVFTVNQIPQLLKIYHTKSTYGFNFSFTTLTAAAQACELIGGAITKVPAPTIVMAIRGLFIYLIYVYMFKKYGPKH